MGHWSISCFFVTFDTHNIAMQPVTSISRESEFCTESIRLLAALDRLILHGKPLGEIISRPPAVLVVVSLGGAEHPDTRDHQSLR